MALKAEQITVIVDTREQQAYDLSPLGAVSSTLATGDYSVLGLEDLVALERKSLDDMLQCVGNERARFEGELLRMRAFPHRAVVIEGTWGQLEAGEYRSRLNPKSATHSLISWMARYSVPFVFVGNRAAGERFARYFLFSAAKRHWERGQAFLAAVESTETERGAA